MCRLKYCNNQAIVDEEDNDEDTDDDNIDIDDEAESEDDWAREHRNQIVFVIM